MEPPPEIRGMLEADTAALLESLLDTPSKEDCED